MNILILTAKYGMGHYMASNAIKQELENENIHVEVIDFFDIIFPRIKNVIYNSFNFLVSRCSRIYNFLYKFSANTSEAPFKTIIGRRLEKIIEESSVDIVISTFPACSKYISAYKKKTTKDLKLYTYITDVEVNHEWITDETDSYFVASNESRLVSLLVDLPIYASTTCVNASIPVVAVRCGGNVYVTLGSRTA